MAEKCCPKGRRKDLKTGECKPSTIDDYIEDKRKEYGGETFPMTPFNSGLLAGMDHINLKIKNGELK